MGGGLEEPEMEALDAFGGGAGVDEAVEELLGVAVGGILAGGEGLFGGDGGEDALVDQRKEDGQGKGSQVLKKGLAGEAFLAPDPEGV